MREKLNSNPLLQAAVIGVLLLGSLFFLMSTMGGGEEASEAGAVEATVSVEGAGATEATAPLGAVPASVPPDVLAEAAPPPPQEITAAFDSGRTVVLLFVRNSGIDDRLVRRSLGALQSLPDVATFVVPARRISRFSAITQGVEVNRVPALVVIRPKGVGGSIPSASVEYGFQRPENVVQAVIDAGYRGRTLGYHP